MEREVQNETSPPKFSASGRGRRRTAERDEVFEDDCAAADAEEGASLTDQERENVRSSRERVRREIEQLKREALG